jgi:hypothetical protein
MKKDEIPQQPQSMFNGETKGVYALDENGNYVLGQTTGWDPEITALNLALEEIERLANDALQRAQAGLTSPLEYHMHVRRMDLPMLAKAVGKFQWQVRRHFKPANFNKLRRQQLETYAQVLDIDIKTLTSLPDAQAE